jgi:hypothetical protein
MMGYGKYGTASSINIKEQNEVLIAPTFPQNHTLGHRKYR